MYITATVTATTTTTTTTTTTNVNDNNDNNYCFERRIYHNLSKSIQIAAGLKPLKPAANGRSVVMCKCNVQTPRHCKRKQCYI